MSKHGYQAIIASLLAHVIVLAGIHWFSNGSRIFLPGIINDDPIEVEMIEIPEIPEEVIIDPQTGEPIKNLVANRDVQQSYDVDNFSRRSQEQMAEQVMSDLKSLEQQVFDELAAERDQRVKDTDVTIEDPEKKDLSDYDWYKEESYAGNVTISYSLPGRHDLDLKNPGYTCRTSGQVTINIEVAQDGTVTGTSINSALTTTSNPCLIEQSEKYAKMSRFNSSLSAEKKQEGTITYLFIAQ